MVKEDRKSPSALLAITVHFHLKKNQAVRKAACSKAPDSRTECQRAQRRCSGFGMCNGSPFRVLLDS